MTLVCSTSLCTAPVLAKNLLAHFLPFALIFLSISHLPQWVYNLLISQFTQMFSSGIFNQKCCFTFCPLCCEYDLISADFLLQCQHAAFWAFWWEHHDPGKMGLDMVLAQHNPHKKTCSLSSILSTDPKDSDWLKTMLFLDQLRMRIQEHVSLCKSH